MIIHQIDLSLPTFWILNPFIIGFKITKVLILQNLYLVRYSYFYKFITYPFKCQVWIQVNIQAKKDLFTWNLCIDLSLRSIDMQMLQRVVFLGLNFHHANNKKKISQASMNQKNLEGNRIQWIWGMWLKRLAFWNKK
jgi:hypothetical protein